MKRTEADISIINRAVYYCFILILFTVPIFLTTHSGNPFILSKNDSLILFSGLFVIIASLSLYHNAKLKTKKSKLFFSAELDLYVIFFFIAAILSTVFSVNFNVSYYGYYNRPFGLEIYLYILLVYIFSSTVLTDSTRIDKVFRLMEICAVIIALYALLQFAGGDPFKIQPQDSHRPVGTLGNAVFLGGFLILTYPFSLMNIIRKKKLDTSVVFIVIIVSAVIVSQTRTAYAAVIVESVICVLLYLIINSENRESFIKKLKHFFIITGGLVILLIIFILIEKENVFVKRFINITSLIQNPRWLLWGESFKVFAKYPVFGCGLCTFPAVFETVYSMSFKLNDVRNYYDNAHSNFIHTLCSMGIIGFTAYLLLLGHTIYILLKTIFSRALKSQQKIIYIGFLAMLCGYIIYGIADFDEITIMLYFFVYLSILKMQMRADNISHSFKLTGKQIVPVNIIGAALVIILFIFVVYNSYIAVRQFAADINFLTAYSLASQKKVQAFDYYTAAIGLWDDNSFYHYEYGGALLDFGVTNLALTDEARRTALEKARTELLSAVRNYPYKSTCMGLVSIACYELGDTVEAERIKNDILGRDSLMVNYRFALADFYMQKKQYDKAMEQILFNCKYDPGDIRLLKTITLLLNDKNCPDPAGYCNKILAVDPKNEAVMYYLKTKK